MELKNNPEEELQNDLELSEEAEVVEEGKKPAVEDEDEDEDEKEDDVEEKKAVKKEGKKKQLKGSYKEDLDLLINSTEGLTEDFQNKAATIFEAAFTSKIHETTEKLEEKYQVQLVEETDAIRTDLVEKVDSYLDYAVNEWVKDNEVAIDGGLRTEITEDFMGALKTLFTEHYIEVPESKVDLFDTLEKESSRLNDELQESKSEAEALKEEI